MSDVEQIEISLEHAKEIVAKRDWAHKLSSNREFKKLILDGYFKDEAARLVGRAADPSMKAHKEDIFSAIEAISHLRQFLQNIIRMGDVAAADIEEHEEALEEARILATEG